ncbi:MAG: Do family serine endopeptidase [Verrucomicrobiales bacterium]|nr:Do family serine endopeptidase [Verrucomicrobiales bacterium]
MKRSFKPLLHTLAFGGLLAFSVEAAFADEIKFADLEKKILVDKTPIADAGGAVASYAPALKKVMPAVVTIFSSKSIETTSARNPQQEELFRRMFPDIPDDFFEREENGGGGPGGKERKEEGLGSGVVISPDGYILTNNHVVGDADEIKVTITSDKKEHIAKLIGADPQTDVALIKIDAKDLPFITIGDSSILQIGDVAMAVGAPLGLEQTATLGIISAVGRSDLNIVQNGYESFIQTDAAINRGNSGGALVDASGRLIGIPTAIQSNFSGGNIGIGFAIPSNMALNIVQRLLDGGGVVKRGFLGVFLRELDPNMAKALGRDDNTGVLVAEVGDKTPAEASGMKPGDLIIGYAGKPVESMQQLRLDISNTAPNAEVVFNLIRKGEKTDLKVKLGDLDDQKLTSAGGAPSRPGSPKEMELVEGVSITDIDDDSRKSLQLDDTVQGVLVKSVKDNVPAAESGLRPGMVITQIDQTNVKTAAEAYKLVEGFEADVILLQVYAAGRRDIIAIPLKK